MPLVILEREGRAIGGRGRSARTGPVLSYLVRYIYVHKGRKKEKEKRKREEQGNKDRKEEEIKKRKVQYPMVVS